LKLVPDKLAEPLKWASPKTIFVNSMSDLFQEGVPDSYVEQVVRVMQMANWHTYQVLTKRADRVRDMLAGPLAFAAQDEHIWWGVSVEDKKYGLPRLDALRNTSAAMRFLSVEPLLEDLGQIDLTGIDWVIVGGESGHGARPMEKDWVLNIQRQCLSAKVDFFFKQWGGVQKKKAGRLLNGRTYDDMPARASVSVLSHRERVALVSEVSSWLSNGPSSVVQRIA
jgi:protein gp37